LIEDYACDRIEQLNASERVYIELMTCVNKCSPNKFIELGKVKYHKQHNEAYYIDNNDEINQHRHENIPCFNCGCTCTRTNKSRHEKSKRHHKNTLSDSEGCISDITIWTKK